MKATISAAGSYPISYSDVKEWLRLDNDDEQSTINMLIAMAFSYAEKKLDMTLSSGRTGTVVHYTLQRNSLYEMPYGPVSSVTTVIDDNLKNIVDFDVVHAGDKAFCKINEGYTLPVTITYAVGATCPSPIKTALLIHVATLFANREAVMKGGQVSVPHSIDSVYDMYSRSERIG